MKFLVLGAGGIGAYFGVKLITDGNDVVFITRGEHYEALKSGTLKLQHPEFIFDNKVKVYPSLDKCEDEIDSFDAVLLTTKSTSTQEIAKQLQQCLANSEKIPYIISLQNGVENEVLLSDYFDKKVIIGGLTRKIGSHIVRPSVIKATGNAETIVGSLLATNENQKFLNELINTFNSAGIPTNQTDDILKELWKKLVINNGVNGICALIEEETGIVMHNEKLAKIVHKMMEETAIAAKNMNITLTKKDVDEMFVLITNFDSIKPSMLVDLEHNRKLEIDEICNVVIRNCEAQNYDAAYTKTISYLLEFKAKKLGILN